jgi:hypothetical protein
MMIILQKEKLFIVVFVNCMLDHKLLYLLVNNKLESYLRKEK